MKKRFGQHFLSDPRILNRIVRFAEVAPGDTVVEIGPGAGALTRELAKAAKRVIAVEIDHDLIPQLRETMPSNVEIVEADALEVDFRTLLPGPFHLVGNLPYNVATPLFKRFIECRDVILDVTVMIQKEVAERIVANAGDDAYGPLSVLIQCYAAPKLGFTVAPGSFKPRPKVDSAVIRLAWKPNIAGGQDFTDFVHNAFGTRRKTLVNNLVRMLPHLPREELIAFIAASGIASGTRPENLSVDDFHRLYNQIRRH